MLHYFDRTGAAITRGRWAELIRCPSYTRIGTSEAPERRLVTTEWLGLWSDGEAVRRLFVTRAYRWRKPGTGGVAGWIEIPESVTWTATEEDAKRMHEKLWRGK